MERFISCGPVYALICGVDLQHISQISIKPAYKWRYTQALSTIPSVDKKDAEPKALKCNAFGSTLYFLFRNMSLNLLMLVRIFLTLFYSTQKISVWAAIYLMYYLIVL